MSVDVTDGEVSVIRLLRTVQAKAPDPIKMQFRSYEAARDGEGLRKAAEPLLGKLKLAPFMPAEAGFVFPLSDMQRDVILFYAAIQDPKAAALKAKIDGLLGWGAWNSVAGVATAIPNNPYRFTGGDVRRVFDPAGAIIEMSDGQAQAKTFLNTIASDPKAADLNRNVQQWLGWGGFETVAKLIQDHPEIPFRFTADELRSVFDGAKRIAPRPLAQIQLLDIWRGLETSDSADVRKLYQDLDARVKHGCWKSIADMLGSSEKFPVRPLTPELLRATFDPAGRYGNDDACAALAPPDPSAAAKAIIWTMGAGLAVYNWGGDAVDSVEDWTKGAASSVSDWTAGAVSDAGDWFKGAAGDAGGWLSDTGGEAFDWVSGATDSAVNWTSGAAEDVEDAIEDVAGSAGSWLSGAGRSIGSIFGF